MKVKARFRGSIPQSKFVNSQSEFPAFVGGFGSGKTEALIKRALRLKIKYRTAPIAYYLPTYDLVRMIGYPRMGEELRKMGIKFSLNKAEHVINTMKYGQIFFRTLDNPDRIVGYEVAHSFVDELDTLKKEKAKECWEAILARNRFEIDGLNTISVGTTPEGYKFVYDMWKKKQIEGYELIKASTHSNQRNLPKNYIRNLMNSYPEELISAYINGDFVNLTAGQVYTSFDRDRNNSKESVYPDDILHIGIDFNIGKMSGVVHVIRKNNKGEDEYHAVDEFFGLQDTNHLIKAINNRYPDHKIYAYPDASSNNRKTQDISRTDYTLLKNAFFRVNRKKSNPLVQDRINSLNALLYNGEGKIRYYVSVANCPELVECFEQQVYNNGIPDKTRGKDHMLDASGYFAHWVAPIKRKTSNSRRGQMLSLGF